MTNTKCGLNLKIIQIVGIVCILPPNFSESPLGSSDPFGGDKLELEGVFSEIFGAGEAFDLRLGESIEDFSDEL